MPRLGIAKEFLASYARLEKPVRKAVDEALGKFTEHTFAGLHLEKLHGAKDPRIRTVRITNFWRGVVIAPDQGDEYHLLTVLPHDDANAYATSKRFSVNEVFGVVDVRDQMALDALQPALQAEAASAAKEPLFSHVKDGEFTQLGIDAQVLPLVRLMVSEAHLKAFESLLPEAQYDALQGLASGLSPDEVWHELCDRLLAGEPPAEIDPDDLAAAIERTPDKYTMVSGPDELAKMLANPFALWRTFLHPKQENIAFRPSYGGSALVSGGAGTGKTVTAVHRAAFLASQPTTGQILLTTFTNNLADSLADQVALLVDDDRAQARLDVMTVNKLAYQVVSEAERHQPEIIGQHALGRLWKSAASRIIGALSPTFLEREWEQVILAQDLSDRMAYLGCDRHGRGRSIRPVQRKQAWEAIAYVVGELRAAGLRTHLQVVADAARILAEQGQPRYRHILVDEGQDLHPAQWRLLRYAVAKGPDDLFIVSDPNQRIYDNRVSLNRVGIEVRGRSKRLTLSYRTTQEILNWSVKLLGGKGTQGLDDEPDKLNGYRSQIHGRRPIVDRFPNWQAQLDGVVGKVREWLADGVEAHAVGIAARNRTQVRNIREALDRAGVANAEKEQHDAVRVGTMHGMKGLEFRCVSVAGIDEGSVPSPAAVTALTDDPAAHEQDMQRERCLLFVACTRARDMLYVSHSTSPSQFLVRP